MARKQSEEITDNDTILAVPSSAATGAAAVEPTTALTEAAQGEESMAAAIDEGVRDARAAAERLFPAVGGLLRKGVYNGFYYLTYGVVFGGLAVGHLVPKGSAVAEGVREGAKAACHDFEEWEAGAPAAAPEEGLTAV